MIQKPKIQYVGDFYVHGSEARQLELEPKRIRTKLPLARLQQIEKIYVDPIAILGIVVALVMLVVMVVGVQQLEDDWAEYQRMSEYVSSLKKTNYDLEKTYRESYDLDDIQVKALALGLVPEEELTVRTVTVTIPVPEPEPTRVEEIVMFLEGLFA